MPLSAEKKKSFLLSQETTLVDDLLSSDDVQEPETALEMAFKEGSTIAL